MLIKYRVGLYLTLVSIIAITLATAIPKPSDEKRQLHDDLSKIKHYDDEHHNIQYDHEAFLGEDESKTFDRLPPEESRRRLG